MRTTINKRTAAAPGAATYVTKLAPPDWAEYCIIHVKATTAAASTYDLKVSIDSLDGEGTALDVPTAAIDQIVAGGTDIQRVLAFGNLRAAVAGTGIDSIVWPLCGHMDVTETVVGTVTDVDLDFEFWGNGR